MRGRILVVCGVLVGLGLYALSRRGPGRGSPGLPAPVAATPAAAAAVRGPQDELEREPLPGASTPALPAGEPASARAAAAVPVRRAGTLEIQVLRAGAPVPGGRGWLLQGERRELPVELHEAAPGYDPGALLPALADAEGVLRYSGLAPGPYRAAVEVLGQRLECSLRLPAEGALERIVLLLGAATVEGRVHDDEGLPLQGARVSLGNRNGRPCSRFAESDAGGRYRIAEVAPGPHWISAHPGGSLWNPGTSKTCTVPATGVLRVDFGAPAGELRPFRGVLRNSSGEPLPGPGRIYVRPEDEDENRFYSYSEDGAFDLRLRPGRYTLSLDLPRAYQERLPLGTLEMPDAALERDLVLSGMRLRVWLQVVGQAPELQLSVRERDQAAHLRLVPLGDGSWVRDGLDPAHDHDLFVYPWVFQDGGLPQLEFTPLPGSREHVLRVSVRAP